MVVEEAVVVEADKHDPLQTQAVVEEEEEEEDYPHYHLEQPFRPSHSNNPK
jgi:hypothetical protein